MQGHGQAKRQRGRPTGLEVDRMSVEGSRVLEAERQGKWPCGRQVGQEVDHEKEVETKVPRDGEVQQTKGVEVDQRHEGPVQVVERQSKGLRCRLRAGLEP